MKSNLPTTNELLEWKIEAAELDMSLIEYITQIVRSFKFSKVNKPKLGTIEDYLSN